MYAHEAARSQAIEGVRKVLDAAVEVAVSTPPPGVDADLAVPCFPLAAKLRKKPEEIARQLADHMPPLGLLQQPRADGGYLNFPFNRAAYAKAVMEDLGRLGDDYGRGEEGGGRRVVIDFSSPNVARPMSVGHLRSTIIGAALHKLFAFGGYAPVGVNHFADWGTQFGTLLYGLTHWLDRQAYQKDPIKELLRVYVKFEEEAERDPPLRDQAREWALRLERDEPEARRMWEEIVRHSLAEFHKIYDRLDVHFDSWRGESAYAEDSQAIIDEAIRRGVAVEDQGALIVPLEDVGIKTPLLLRSSDGRTLYSTRDIAAAIYRIRTYNPAQLIYVVGADQQLHFRQLFATLQKMGYTQPAYIHVEFGLVTLPEGRMSTRKGRIVFLEDLLTEAIARAEEIVKEKNPELSESERRDVARQVGVGAVKYADLSQSRVKNIVFDWNRMLSLEGDSAPYLQYTYVRARGIIRKGGEPFPAGGIDVRATETKEEWALIKHLSRFPEARSEAAKTYSPHVVANYLYQLAQTFHAFYHEAPVLQADDEALRDSRMAMVQATAAVMRTGLGLLGIGVPERM